MLQIVGLLVAVYVMARSVSAITSTAASGESVFGKIAYGLCLAATIALTGMLLNSGTPTR